MLSKKQSQGFSLIEMLVVLATTIIVATIVVDSFSKTTGPKALDRNIRVALSLIEQARNATLSAKNSSVYGVHFETTKAVMFTGSSYSDSAPSNIVEPMGSVVQISAISLSGGGSNVIFNRLTGETGQSGTVKLSLIASSTQSKTITIFATGLAESK